MQVYIIKQPFWMPDAIPDPPHLHNRPHMALQITNACIVLEGKSQSEVPTLRTGHGVGIVIDGYRRKWFRLLESSDTRPDTQADVVNTVLSHRAHVYLG